jgi:hypothetical protein
MLWHLPSSFVQCYGTLRRVDQLTSLSNFYEGRKVPEGTAVDDLNSLTRTNTDLSLTGPADYNLC